MNLAPRGRDDASPALQRQARGPVLLSIDDADARRELQSVLRARGLASTEDATLSAAEALAPVRGVSLEAAAELAERCQAAAEAGRPIVLLAPLAGDPEPRDTAAALGYLSTHGAIVCRDPSVWIETLVLVARIGLPAGPRVAIVASPGSMVAAQAESLAHEQALLGARFSSNLSGLAQTGHDVVLADVHSLAADTPSVVGSALVVPVSTRAESLQGGVAALVDIRHAIAAVRLASDLSVRMAEGLGPAGDEPPEWLEADRPRFERQLGKLSGRGGDHETKVLLSSFGVVVTRQAVATTPSAASRIAKRAGFPVDVKAWGPDIRSEADGCPVERQIETAADVRRAFAAATAALDLPTGAPVIVRASPPRGRELRVRLVDLPDVGWTAVAELPGRPEPLAAPAPLTAHDAQALAGLVSATRADDKPVDSEGLAELLIRCSYLVWLYSDELRSLDLSRIVVPTDDASAVLVVDASVELRTPV